MTVQAPAPSALNGSQWINGASLVRPRQPPPKKNKQPLPGHHPVPQEPLPISAGRGSKRPGPKMDQEWTKSGPKMVQVPPPLSGKDMASKVIQNGGAYTLPDLNITVTSVPRKLAAARADIITLPVSTFLFWVRFPVRTNLLTKSKKNFESLESRIYLKSCNFDKK